MKTIDLTLSLDLSHRFAGETDERRALLSGHLGTHFDVMDKAFDLACLQLPCVAFDVSGVRGRDIEATDLDLDRLAGAGAVVFGSGYIERCPYGTGAYFTAHPQLAPRLIDALLAAGIKIIGLDFAGLRRGAEHPRADRRCADRGIFVVENLCNVASLLDGKPYARCTLYTFPLALKGLTGLPCRVVATV